MARSIRQIIGDADADAVLAYAAKRVPHCVGSLSQAVNGRCPTCKQVVTRADAKAWAAGWRR
jgi:hypothetical protein